MLGNAPFYFAFVTNRCLLDRGRLPFHLGPRWPGAFGQFRRTPSWLCIAPPISSANESLEVMSVVSRGP